MERRKFLKTFAAFAGSGLALVLPNVAEAAAPAAPVVTEKIVERIVEKEVPATVVTLEQFRDAIDAFEGGLIGSSDLKRIRDLYMQQTHIKLAADEVRLNAANPGREAAMETENLRIFNAPRK